MTVMDRFSVFAFALGDPPPAASELIAAAKHADALGFHSISLPHHLTLPPRRSTRVSRVGTSLIR